MATNKEITPVEGEFIGLDVGDVRIGVARINSFAKIAEPLELILNNQQDTLSSVLEVVNKNNAIGIVIGLPRGLDGQETAQTGKTRDFTNKLKEVSTVPLYLIDEAGSTKDAELKRSAYPNVAVDNLAAMVILEDFIAVSNKHALEV